MKCFSIKELERFCDIQAHTIRIWEKRYRVPTPARRGSIRSYNLEEVKLLLDICLLNKNGLRISQIANLDGGAIEQKVEELSGTFNQLANATNKLICYMFLSDIENFELLLNDCISNFGLDSTVKNVIVPFLHKVDLLSYSESSNEVHFVVTAIRKKIILAIELAKPEQVLQQTAVLFLPQKEHYDLVLLYIHYILKSMGLRVLYLGTNIPTTNLKSIVRDKHPDLFFTYITSGQRFKLDDIVAQLKATASDAKLFVATAEEPEKGREKDYITIVHYNKVYQTMDTYFQEHA